MDSQVFRQKSVDRVKSPENLNDYIKVTNINLWILLAAIATLLIGVCFWGALGTIETKTEVGAAVLDGQAICQGDADITMTIKKLLNKGTEVTFELNGSIGKITGVDEKKWIIYGEIDLPDCTGAAYIHESINPMSLLFN